MKATDVRPGIAIKYDGKLYVITKTEHRTPGNLRAFMQIKMKDVKSGVSIERRFASSEDVEAVSLDRRDMEYLYSDSSGHVFMDTENYDQVVVPNELIADYMVYVKPNTNITALTTEGNIVAVELPKTVDLKVTDCAPGIKSATATNVQKEAVFETGLKGRVPDFIKIGEVVRINTETGEYLSRI